MKKKNPNKDPTQQQINSDIELELLAYGTPSQ